MRDGRTPRLLLVLLALAGIYRVSLLDRGTSAFVDETLYFTSVMALQSLAAGDVPAAFTHIPVARGRQGAAIVQLPIAALQAIPSAFGIPASNPRSLLIPALFNVVVSIAVLFMFYRIASVACGDRSAALVAATVYALLVNTNLYVRHLLPYDLALLAGMCGLWLIVSRPLTPRRGAMVGILAGAVPTLYSGYYLLTPVLGLAMAGIGSRSGWRQLVALGGAFAIGVSVSLAAIELVCRLGGVSWFQSSIVLSRSITMGSFEEGWTFLPKYLIEIERVSGVLLLAAPGVWTCRAVSRLGHGGWHPLDWLILSALIGWAWQAFLSAEMHRMVLYGRLLHLWIPFMALALADALSALTRPGARRVMFAAIVAAAAIVRAPSVTAYSELAYPPDVLYRLGIDAARVPADRKVCELTIGTDYASPGPINRATGAPYSTDTNYILLNFCQGAPSSERLNPGFEEQALIFDGPHWLTFPAYGFEGFTPADRETMKRNGYRVRVYRTQ